MATGVDLVPLIDEGLGNSAYLVDLGDGRALAVDVSRDLRAVHAAAAKHGLTVAFAADTHLHADFLSGAHQLGVTGGAKVLASAAGHREFAHTGLHDGDEGDLGGLRVRALLNTRPHPRTLGVPVARRRPGSRSIHRRFADRRFGGPHRPDLRRTDRRTGP